MVSNDDYDVGSIVMMKKPHPCKSKSREFEVIRVGADIKIKCQGCGNVLMFARNDFNNKVKQVLKK